MRRLICLAFVAAEPLRSTARGQRPQWTGRNGAASARSGISTETGLLRQWPAAGPRRLWSSSNLGNGFGSIAVRGDRIFVQGARNGQSSVAALNRADGKQVWVRALGAAGDNDRGPGPEARRRSTAIACTC